MMTSAIRIERRGTGVYPYLFHAGSYFWPIAPEVVEALKRHATDPPSVMATEDGLGMVFGNLVGNAVKYTPSGGRVAVRLSRDKQGVAVDVRDSGIGIGSDEIARLGEEFFRASNAKSSGIGGTGLGLAIVRQHLDRWGARLEVESEVGHGSTFRVVFPSADERSSIQALPGTAHSVPEGT